MCEDPAAEWRRIACDIRDLVLRADPNAREELSAWAVGYIRSYVLQHLTRRRFGFRDPFVEVAQQVADMEVAELVQPGMGTGGAAPVLSAGLERELRRTPWSSAPSLPETENLNDRPGTDPREILARCDDSTLYFAMRELLRLRANQGLEHRWVEEHPPEGRLLRQLKEAARAHAVCRLQRDATGRMLVTDASDLGKRAHTRDEIADCLESRPIESARSILACLVPSLRANAEHGGYCFVMDLVREVHADRVRRFQGWWVERRARQNHLPLVCGGLTTALAQEKIRRSLCALAERILEKQPLPAPAPFRCLLYTSDAADEFR
ncbi:MAG: hypothetical protein QUU85_06040, partial [Candidatus Eisenbacteria bacterium]|nr:hypothetical protein [Candidatus Eisenbacteria bacterium]